MSKEESTVTRPWGAYTTLSTTPTHQVKRITVNYGGRLSYQRHQRRAEHWFIVSGTGKITRNGYVQRVNPGSSFDIPIGMLHRVEGTSRQPLVFIEVQTGSYFGEDDIERVEDDYGRAEETED